MSLTLILKSSTVFDVRAFGPEAPHTKKWLYHGKITKLVRGVSLAAVKQYVADDLGNKVGIILSLTEYQHVKEELHDRAIIIKRRDKCSMNLAGLKEIVL